MCFAQISTCIMTYAHVLCVGNSYNSIGGGTGGLKGSSPPPNISDYSAILINNN